ncbi:uncharacterized protein LOC143919246 [Arctopsyche grandis]|uniref:uncharacterized protein LOC143919246 n=1 Tax=Arctopsyche grandis TaxID=121162 RepID=UPI00406D9DD7
MASCSSTAPEKLQLSMEMSLDERLTNFVRQFVIELESTLQLHFDILDGNINKSGQTPKFIGTALGLFANHYICKGADKVVKLFQTPLTKPFEVIEKNKSLEYYEIVYSFQQSKEKGRQVFLDIAIDVFASFEFQFAGITSTRGDQKAIQRVARDAAQRFLRRFKSEGESYSDNTILRKFQKGANKLKKSIKPQLPAPTVDYKMNALKVVEGKSKSKSELIPDQVWKPGFDILYKCKKCKSEISDWNTCDLFEKVGVAEKRIDSDDYFVYATSKCNCEKYGYRLLFPGENVNKYYSSEKCKTTCMHPVIVESRDFYESKRDIILKLINDNDQVSIQQKILELAEETKTDIAQFKDAFEKENQDELITTEIFDSQLMEIITRYNDIQKHFQTAEKHRNTLATENKELHQATMRTVEELELQIKHVKVTIGQNTVEKDKSRRVLFRVKDPVIPFEGRIKELEDLHEALMNKKATLISQTATIVGLGGIGKTELAKKYVEKYKNHYYNILFINADKSETLMESFETLASEIGIKLISTNRKERDITDVVKDIYRNLTNSGKTLVIFDNVEEYEDIKKYIFENCSYNENHELCTLITSRSKKWNVGEKGDIKLIQLNVFTEDEAMSYLRKCLQNEDEDDHKSLMNLLQRIPLGLKQAVGYIKQQNQKSNTRKHEKIFNIQDYLILYQDQWKEVLHKGLGEVDDLYDKTIATTWRITMQKIKECGECGKLALLVLKIMAYLAPDDIDIEKIFSKLEKNVHKLYEAVDLLHDYSMINNERGIVNVHRLVQKAIQIHLIEMKNEENVLNKALKLLEGCNFNEHIVSVWEHSSNYPKIVKNNYNDSKYGILKKSPIDLFIIHRNDTIVVAKILKHIKCDLNTFMHLACQYGNEEVLKFLIERGADINYKNHLNETLLHSAAKYADVNILKLLIDKGLDVNISNKIGDTPLLIAAEFKNTESFLFLLKSGASPIAINAVGEIVIHHIFRNYNVLYFKKENDQSTIDNLQLLTDKGVDLKMTDEYGEETSLFCAVEFDETLAIRLFLKSRASPTPITFTIGEKVLHHLKNKGGVEEFELLRSEKANINILPIDKNDRSPIHLAAIRGSIDILQLLIDKGLDVNMTDINGETPLLLAASFGKLEAVKYLLKNSADPKIISKLGETLIHKAAGGCDLDSFKFIMELGFELTVVDKLGNSLLHSAVHEINMNIIEFLVENGIQPNTANTFGYTPLHDISCSCRNITKYMVELLIKLGANPNALSKSNNTPLHLASIVNNLKAVIVLIEKNAEINIRNKFGRSALHFASSKSHSRIIEYLLKNGADVNVFDSKGRTPLHHVSRNGNLNLVCLLLLNGANPRYLDKAGCSLMHVAVFHFKYVDVKSIIRNLDGIDVNDRDVEGKTPLHLAVECGRVSIVGLLVRKGGDISATDQNGNTPLDLATKFNHAKVMDFFKGLHIKNTRKSNTNAMEKSGSTHLFLFFCIAPILLYIIYKILM